ncbi:MAG: ParB/RepB/Spo0J family partition protein, partial [Anaerovoracaceae bacterium]
MPNGTENEIRLPSLDDLFSSQKERNEAKLKRIEEIPLSEIDPFPDHPFKVKDDEDMDNLVESIRAQGIITPAAVRKKKDGRYELVSGHRRKRACEILGMTTLRCEVLNLSKDEATIFMVESNFQRTTILPSEKAFAYKMRLEAIKSQIGRMKDNQRRGMNYAGAPVEPQLRQAQDHLMRAYGMTEEEVRAVGTPSSRRKEEVSPVGTQVNRSTNQITRESGDGKTQIYRYIRLTELIPQLLDLVDEGKIAIRPAVELSYLEHRQIDVYNCIEMEQCTPTHAQAIRMRKLYQEGKLTKEAVMDIMLEEKPNQKERFVLRGDRV